MDRELARRSHAVLQGALEVHEPGRADYIRAACAADPVLAGQVDRLLAAISGSSAFLETPALAQPHGFSHDRGPKRIGGYEIVRVIGVGGMATVYEAIQEQPRRRVALKTMRHGLTETSAVQRFQYETEVLARLQHPGIAQIFEAGAYDAGHGVSTPFFAMEYIENASTITAYAQRHGLPPNSRLQMFASVCDAVQHGHQLGVIHRDLKPANILVDAHGRPKTIDFGVARSVDPQQDRITQYTDFGQLIGTLNYMSPEQCSGGRNIDIRSDVYSLGVVLYELLCGRLPHDLSGAPVPEALRIIREDVPPAPSAMDPRYRGDLDAILLMALDKEPDRRYATAAALAADIRRHLHHETIEARPPTMVYKVRLFVRRHRVLVSAMTAVILAIVGGGLLSARFAYQALQESRRRLDAEELALAERDAARWQAYVANIAGAFAAHQTNEFQQLRTRLAAASQEHRGWEWHFLAGLSERSEQTILAHNDMIFAFAATRDGSRLATGCRDGSIRIWSAATGAPVARLEGTPKFAVLAVAFSPDGRRLASGSDDRKLRLWDIETGLQIEILGEHDGPIASLAWSQGGILASAGSDGIARLWDIDRNQTILPLTDQPGGIHGVGFSDEGSRLLTWSRSGDVWLRKMGDLSVLHRWKSEVRPECAAISLDGTLVAAGGADSRATVWDAVTGETRHRLETPLSLSTVRSLAFSRDGKRLAAGQIHRGILLWSMVDGTQIAKLAGHEEAVSGLLFSPDDTRLCSTSWDRTIRIWDVDPASPSGLIRVLRGHEDHLLTAAFSPDGGILASGGKDNVIRLFDPELGLQLGALRGHSGAIYSLAFAPDEPLLASGAADGSICLWNTISGTHLASLNYGSTVWTVAFSPDGCLIAGAGEDSMIRIWDLESRQLIHTLSGHDKRVIDIAFSPDGSQLAASSRDHAVTVWDTATGELVHRLAEHEADVFAVLFSQDGRLLYSGSRDQTVRVWDPHSGAQIHVLGGHGQFVTSLAMSPDGARLAAGSWFGEIVLWDLATHDMVASFKGHDQAIRAVAFGPRGRWLASASYDRTVRIHDAVLPTTRRAALRHAQDQYRAAGELVARLSPTCPTVEELVETIASDTTLDDEGRTWAQKLVLARTLASDQP